MGGFNVPYLDPAGSEGQPQTSLLNDSPQASPEPKTSRSAYRQGPKAPLEKFSRRARKAQDSLMTLSGNTGNSIL